MNIASSISKLLTNKLVLNIVSFLAFFNVIGYIVIGNINYVLYFVIFAVLIRFFSNNMTIILGAPLIFVNLLSIKDGMREGLENNMEKGDGPENDEKEKEKENQNMIDKIVKDNKDKPEKKTGQGLPMHPIDDGSDNHAQSTGSEQEGFQTGSRKNTGNNIDNATTIDDAYDNIIGNDGIQKITQNLMKHQLQLSKAVENMTPMIN
jgi:hypothetical protein